MQPLVLMSGRGLREPSGRLAGPGTLRALCTAIVNVGVELVLSR